MPTGPTEIPVLETPRLRLRGHTAEDFGACVALWGNAEVTRFIGGQPSTPEETWSRLLRYSGHWGLLGYGYWVIEEKETGDFVGEVGLANLHRDIVPSLGEEPEAGWVLSPTKHGRGYATEAMTAVMAWGCARFHPLPISCVINPDNKASLRVAKKIGFTKSCRALYKGSHVFILRTRPDRYVPPVPQDPQ